MHENETHSPRARVASLSNALYIESPLLIGFAIQLCWLLVLVFHGSPWCEGLPPTNQPQSPILRLAFLASFSVAGFAIGYSREKITRHIRKKAVHFLIGLGGAVGMLCACGPLLWGEGFPFPLVFAGTVLASLSCAPSTLLWGEAARRRNQSVLALATSLSAVMAYAFLLALVWIAETNVAGAAGAISLFPLLSVVFVYKAQHDNESYLKPQEFVTMPDGSKMAKEGRAWVETFHDLRISKRAFALRLGKSAVPFGMVYGSLLLESEPLLWASNSMASNPILETLPPLAAALLFLMLFFWPHRNEESSFETRRIMPFFLVFLLISHPLGFASAEITPAIVALVTLASTMLWLYPAELTKRYRVSSMITFGFYSSFLALGILVVFAASMALPLHNLPYPLALCLQLVLLSLGYLSLVTNEQMRKITVLASPPTEAQPHDDAKPQRTPFTQRCQLVADTFLLSHRELEILCLLAKGRNASYVQKELVISEGTVRTHMRNIYRKLNVHSQQELMDLVDTIA